MRPNPVTPRGTQTGAGGAWPKAAVKAGKAAAVGAAAGRGAAAETVKTQSAPVPATEKAKTVKTQSAPVPATEKEETTGTPGWMKTIVAGAARALPMRVLTLAAAATFKYEQYVPLVAAGVCLPQHPSVPFASGAAELNLAGKLEIRGDEVFVHYLDDTGAGRPIGWHG